jgi:tRNA(Ile2) C34 agmatinyltransferase TiaS
MGTTIGVTTAEGILILMKKRKKNNGKLKWRTIQVKVAVCPKCGSNMNEGNGVYKCTHCAYKHREDYHVNGC